MAATLDDTWARVEWAHHHLVELVASLKQFMDEPFTVASELSPDGKQRIDIAQPKPVPNAISLMLGDVVHALRSSLDYLVCSLAESAGQAVTRFHEFPVNRKDKADFEFNGRTTLKGVPNRAIEVIEQFQPYADGTKKLALLHTADIVDKHRAILVANVVVEPVRVRVDDPNGARFSNVFLRAPSGGVISIADVDAGKAALSAYHSHVMLNEPQLPRISVDGFAADMYKFVATELLPGFDALGLLPLTERRQLPVVDLSWH